MTERTFSQYLYQGIEGVEGKDCLAFAETFAKKALTGNEIGSWDGGLNGFCAPEKL
jgi:hypothetical protein